MASFKKYPVKNNAKGYKWMYIVDLGKDPRTGKRIQKCKRGFDTKKEAEAHCGKLINKHYKGEMTTPSKMLFKDYLDQWIRSKRKIRDSTLKNYKNQVYNHIRPELGNAELARLTDNDLYDFYEKLKEEKGLSNTTIHDIHKTVKQILSHAVTKKLIGVNVAEFVEPPARDKKQILVWDYAECQKFLDAVKEHREYMAFLLALTTGMRQSEILALSWKHVDFERNIISVYQSLERGAKGISTKVKSKNSFRSIQVDSQTMFELRRHRRLITEEKNCAGEMYTDLDLVIPTSKGTPINQRNLLRTFYRYMKKANVRKIDFHDLRHTHATMLLREGHNPKAVAERLGHDVRTLMETYAHVLPNMQEQIANNFGSRFYQKKPNIILQKKIM